MKNKLPTLLAIYALGLAMPAVAAEYLIDTKGAHASVNFKIPHLGYSILLGRFDEFSGTFSYDPENPQAAKVEVVIKTASINSNHTARDRHLRSDDFLAVDDYPEARFVGSRFVTQDGASGQLHGQLTLRGVTRDVVIDVEKVGEGDDPWGGYRAGFAGTTSLNLADFGITTDLGPAARAVEMILHVEGVRQ
ncbi:MAG: YceI family protein [Cellvibrionaceae bacterium]